MLERELNRVADFAVEAVTVTALHVRRIAAALHTAARRAKREVGDLAWDYHELAARVRGSARRNRAVGDDSAATGHGEHIAEVISIDLRRRQAN
ncbi:hypothetical protein [Mycobacterium sherrisii]|uniref:hypothetical protein n=1 Tax=Mycobacterium sherrisii TaxID=243061 RepID=UPI000A15AF63|nr:hypothetical protein [Mycobacterium sherrisii]MCV7028910.1 hypothetical protein [Mycobacterium sherrisii]ORW80213.1 hypothetical protein AWC25_04215 [Mycobacterium sherrisii]